MTVEPAGGAPVRRAADAEVDRGSLGLARAANFARRYGVLILIVALMIVLTLSSDAFLTSRNLLNILTQNSPLPIVAIAGTLVIIAGGFDLSAGAIFAVAYVSRRGSRSAPAPLLGLAPAPVVGLGLGSSTASSSPGCASTRSSPRWRRASSTAVSPC